MKITILAEAKNTAEVWNRIGWIESAGVKVIDVFETRGE